LEKALALYDKYAAAWNELGRVYAIGHQAGKARQAFENAIAADPQYIPPYVNLAASELREGQYESALATAGKALELDPGAEVAEFIQAAANFKLNRLDAAEKSARDAEDRPHRNIPQLHVILAEIFLRKHDYSNAVAEMRAYLKESPRGEFAAAVKKTLDQMDKSAVNTGNKSVLSPQRPQIAP
jgi:tetratricopeptide (TPR) repeat protein